MTGRIKMLSSGKASGFIRAENGLSVRFDSSAVLAYDAACLAVGQLVTFDLGRGNHPKAVNVCVHTAPRAQESRQQSTRVRYVGFAQRGSVRAYRFERISLGEETATFIVNADMALFTKHHVGIQEGPALCLHVLMAELDAAGAARRPPCERLLTDQDMLAHVASRPIPGTKPRPRRMPHASNAGWRNPAV